MGYGYNGPKCIFIATFKEKCGVYIRFLKYYATFKTIFRENLVITGKYNVEIVLIQEDLLDIYSLHASDGDNFQSLIKFL